MVGWLDPEEDRFLAEIETRRKSFDAAYRAATPQMGHTLSYIAAAHPTISPGVAVSLARAGLTADDPVVARVAEASTNKKAKHSGFGGMVTGAMSKVKSGIDKVLPDQADLSDRADDVYDAAKGTVRTVFTALDAAPQMVQGQFREGIAGRGWGAGAAARAWDQTDLAIMGEQINDEGGIQAGEGFFTGGKVKETQVERTREASKGHMIDGHAVTIGRYFGKQIAEPGSGRYKIVSGLLDATVAIAADPSTYVTGGTSKARLLVQPKLTKTQRLRNSVGLLDTTRLTTQDQLVDNFITSKAGRETIGWLANNSDVYDIRRATKGQLPGELMVAISKESTPQGVEALVRQAIIGDGTIREQFGIRRSMKEGANPLMLNVRNRVENTRLLGQMPGTRLDPTDVTQRIDVFDRALLNGKVDITIRRKLVNDIANAADRTEVLQVVEDGMTEIAARASQMLGKDRLLHLPLDDDAVKVRQIDARNRAREVTKLGFTNHERLTAYNTDDLGRNLNIFGEAIVDGKVVETASPHLLVEHLQTAIDLPDARDIRRATSKFAPIFENQAIKVGVAATDFISGTMFKPLALIRAAWTLRVVGEEQVRMASSGLVSAINNPVGAIAWAVGSDSRVGRTLNKIPGVNTDRGAVTIMGNRFKDEKEARGALTAYQQAMSRGSAGFRGDRTKRVAGKVTVGRTHRDFVKGLADELTQIFADPLGSRVARGDLLPGDNVASANIGTQRIKDWFYDGTGRKFREQLISGGGDAAKLENRVDADRYIDGLFARFETKTAGHDDLRMIAAEGKVGDVALVDDDGKVTKEGMDRLKILVDEGAGPQMVKADLTVAFKESPGSVVADRVDYFVESMFNLLMSRPTNYLSRSPAFKQFYWQRAEELLPMMTREAQQMALANAKKANLSERTLKRMSAAAERGGTGTLDLENADVVAKGFGLDNTRKLLYDLTDRSQLFDITRVIFPFGEAWKEILTTWGRIAKERPQVVRRAGLVVNGARQSGFFHPDPNGSGEEMFSIPASGFLTEKLIGVNAPIQMRAAGLNLFSSTVMPGVGPVVTIPASKMLPDSTEYDKIRETLLPFGDPDTSGGFLESFLPAWAQKLRTASGARTPAQERQFKNATADVMRYLVSTGEYSIDSPEEIERTLKAASKKATALFILRGITQFGAPSAPSYELLVKDKNGDIVFTQMLGEEYRKMREKDPATADAEFIDKFGEGAFLTTIGKSQGDIAPTDRADDFARDNPDLASRFSKTYGLFLPGGEFSYDALNRQQRTGQRTTLAPKEAISRANDRLGRLIYDQAKARVGDKPNEEQTRWLRQVKDAIAAEYPGFGLRPFDTSRLPKMIAEMTDAVSVPTMANTDAGKAIKLYLQARDHAIEQSRAAGLSTFAKAKDAAPLRAWLRQIGRALVAEHPDFESAWERVFDAEMVDDEVETAA